MLPLLGYAQVVTSHFPFLNMIKFLGALPSSIRVNLTSAKPQVNHTKTMESTCFSVNTGNRTVHLIAIYRPPDSNIMEFCNEFINLLENNINSSGELVLLGDFNIAINKPLGAGLATFLDILDSFNLVNKVEKPMHRLSNTLDLIIHDAH